MKSVCDLMGITDAYNNRNRQINTIKTLCPFSSIPLQDVLQYVTDGSGQCSDVIMTLASLYHLGVDCPYSFIIYTNKDAIGIVSPYLDSNRI